MKREKSLYSVVADSVSGTVAVNYGDKRVVVNAASLSSEIQLQAMIHGIKQKIGDAGAVVAGDSGKVDPEEKLRRVLAMAERINRNVWNERASGGTSEEQILIRALGMAMPAKTRDQLAAFVDGLKPDEKRALLGPKSAIAGHVEAIRAELAKDVDTEGLLAGLDAM